MLRLRRIFLQDCRKKRRHSGLRRGFLPCKIGEIDKQDVLLVFLQFLTVKQDILYIQAALGLFQWICFQVWHIRAVPRAALGYSVLDRLP